MGCELLHCSLCKIDSITAVLLGIGVDGLYFEEKYTELCRKKRNVANRIRKTLIKIQRSNGSHSMEDRYFPKPSITVISVLKIKVP